MSNNTIVTVLTKQKPVANEVNTFIPVPVGGTSGQVLAKASDAIGDLEWIDDEGSSSVGWGDVENKPTTFPPSAHTHSIANVIDLQATLDGKASSVHTHVINDVTGLQTALNGKFNIPIGDTTQYVGGGW